MKFAFVFPGQGSQSVGMLAELAVAHPEVQQTFAEASTVLGYDLWHLVSRGPEERLAETEVTQPAMLAAGVAVWRVWRAGGGRVPSLMAGHSLGEYSALVCAETLEFGEAVGLVAARARYMQEAVPAGNGAMAAVLGLTDEEVTALCAQAAEGEVLEPANFNSPSQVVIAGTSGAVARAIARIKAAGAKRAIILPMSVPAHSSLMAPAAARLAERLEAVPLHPPRIPVLHNAHIGTASQPAAIRAALVRQVTAPVRWVETIEKMADDGIGAVVECGPGNVLTGLSKRIVPNLAYYAIHDPRSLSEVHAKIDVAEVAVRGEGACR